MINVTNKNCNFHFFILMEQINCWKCSKGEQKYILFIRFFNDINGNIGDRVEQKKICQHCYSTMALDNGILLASQPPMAVTVIRRLPD